MAKIRKKYNPALKFQQISKIRAKDYLIFDITGVGVQMYYKQKPITICYTEANMLNEVRYKWEFMIGVICQDAFGKSYIKQQIIAPQGEYFTKELSDVLNQYQVAMWNKSNPNQRRTLFWIASTTTVDHITDSWLLQEIENNNGFNTDLHDTNIETLLNYGDI